MIDNERLGYCGQILKIVSNNEDSISLSDIFETLKSNGVKHKDINTSISFLENHYKLIERYSIYTFNVKNDCFRLTPEGVKATENGIENYIDDIEYDKYLDRQVKISTIKTSRWAIGISILSLIISIVIPTLIEKQKDEVPSKTEKQNIIDNNKCKCDTTNNNSNFK